jgi:hypothetical protein
MVRRSFEANLLHRSFKLGVRKCLIFTLGQYD